MLKSLILFLFLLFFLSRVAIASVIDYYSMAILPAIISNPSIGSQSLRIYMQKHTHGIKINKIKNRGYNILSNVPTDLFDMTIQDIQAGTQEHIGAISGWQKVVIDRDDRHAIVTLSDPQSHKLPSTLQVTMRISVEGDNSTWDLNVTGLGNHHTLLQATYPVFTIKSENNDNFFVPYYHGKVFKNTKTKPFDYTTRYPRGWSATMQYMAYYNDQYGLYFGMHDPKASIKHFAAHTVEGGIEVSQSTVVANKTLANNTWELPGYFALDMFHGNWYDAALHYRSWVFDKAAYRPIDTPERLARQRKLGNVAIWVQESVEPYTMAQLEDHIDTFKNYMDIPVGVDWTSFNGKAFDTLYPEIFPEKEGLKDLIVNLKNRYGDSFYLSGYMNGMLYDMDHLASYTNYEAYTIKTMQATVVSQIFNNTHFAYMCPSQEPWQAVMRNSTRKMTTEIGFDGVYIDMVTASSAKECFDPTHHHSLGGGSYWRDGYKQMFYAMHDASTPGTPYVSEEANDFLVDEVDGFLTIGYSTNNQVPAFSAVYAGRVQLIGLPMGWSDYKGSDDPDSQRFYGRVAQSFNYGVQLGRFWMGLVSSTHPRTQRAASFVRNLGRLRVKLKSFISYGRMLKPLALYGNIPQVTFMPHTYPGIYQDPVVIPAIQTSTWTDGEAVALIFVNAKVPENENDSITFSFDVNASQYGIEGDVVKIKEVTQESNSSDENIAAVFTKSVTLKSYESKVFVITPHD